LVEQLERTGAIQVLMFIYNWKGDQPPIMKDLQANVDAHAETIEKAVDLLCTIGFAEQKKSEVFPYPRSVWLTEGGRTIAKSLNAANEAILKEKKKKTPS